MIRDPNVHLELNAAHIWLANQKIVLEGTKLICTFVHKHGDGFLICHLAYL